MHFSSSDWWPPPCRAATGTEPRTEQNRASLAGALRPLCPQSEPQPSLGACLLLARWALPFWPLHERWEVYYNQQDPIQTEACIHMLFTDAQCTQGCTAMTGLRPLLLPLGSSPALLHLFVLPHRQRQTTHTRGMPGLAMDSGLDAFSQYPSLGSFTAPASRLTVEARAVA